MTNRTKAIVSLASIFLLGALCGGLGVGLFVQDQVRDRERLKDPNGFREYFADQLSLSEAQKDSMQTELERAYQQMADIRYQVDQEYRQVFDTLSARLLPVLNTKQQQRLAQERERLLPPQPSTNNAVLSESSIPLSLEEIEEKIAQARVLSDSNLRRKADSSITIDSEGRNVDVEDVLNTTPSASDEDFLDDVAPGDSVFSPQTNEEQLPRIVAFMKTQLSLDEKQTKKLEWVLKKAVERNRWIRENIKDNPTLRVRRLRQSFRMLDRQIANMLTPDQLKIYNESKKQRRAATQRRRNQN